MTKQYRIQWENHFEHFSSEAEALSRYKELKAMVLAQLIWEVYLMEVKEGRYYLRACSFNKRG